MYTKKKLKNKNLKKSLDSEKTWKQIYKWGKKSAKRLNIKNEKDVERLIHGFRK